MIYLILAITASSLISICMRLSENHIKNEMGMFMSNYAVCSILAVAFMDRQGASGGTGILGTENQHLTLIIGIITGMFFLGSFLFLKYNMKYNGIVLSSTFMKLGVIIPTIMAVIVFGEMPTVMQVVGIAIAIVAIIIIHFDNEDDAAETNIQAKGAGNKKILLLVLLLLGGLGDSMSNIFDKVGPASGKDGFLLLTFFTALVITTVIVIAGKKKLCKADVLYGVLVGVPNYFSARFLLASLGAIDAVIVYPTYSVGTMVVIALVGVLAFHERISKKKALALCLIAVAIALLNV